MPTPSCCDRLTLRVVLLKVSPLVARLISVPADLSLEELHDVLQLVLGWSGQAFYNFRIHGQESGRRRHLRTPGSRAFRGQLAWGEDTKVLKFSGSVQTVIVPLFALSEIRS